jgi:hypothetical protein
MQHWLRTLRFAYGQTTQLVVRSNRLPLTAAAPYATTKFRTLSPIPLRAVNFQTVDTIQAQCFLSTWHVHVATAQKRTTSMRRGDVRQQKTTAVARFDESKNKLLDLSATFRTVDMIQALHDEPTHSLNVSRSRRYRRRRGCSYVDAARRCTTATNNKQQQSYVSTNPTLNCCNYLLRLEIRHIPNVHKLSLAIPGRRNRHGIGFAFPTRFGPAGFTHRRRDPNTPPLMIS